MSARMSAPFVDGLEGTQDIPQWVPVMLALLRKELPC